MNEERYLGIDFLKLISIFGMIALHTQRSLKTGVCFNPILYYLGRFCMPVFFMVNGFLILGKDEFDIKYWMRKMFNMIKLLLIWGVITVGYLSIANCRFDIKYLLMNFVEAVRGNGIVPFWWLFSFAFIYTALLFSFQKIKKNIKIVTCSLLVVCSIIDVLSLINIINGGYFIQANVSQRFRIWTWLFYFCFGYYLKMYAPKWRTSTWLIGTFVFSILSFLYQYGLCLLLLGKINSEYCYDNIVIIGWVFFVFNLGLIIRIGEKKIVEQMEKYCFGVFLLHGFVIDLFDLTNRVSNAVESFGMMIGLILVCYLGTICLIKIPKFKFFLMY